MLCPLNPFLGDCCLLSSLSDLQSLHFVRSGSLQHAQISESCTSNFWPWTINPEWPACEKSKYSSLLLIGNCDHYLPLFFFTAITHCIWKALVFPAPYAQPSHDGINLNFNRLPLAYLISLLYIIGYNSVKLFFCFLDYASFSLGAGRVHVMECLEILRFASSLISWLVCEENAKEKGLRMSGSNGWQGRRLHFFC